MHERAATPPPPEPSARPAKTADPAAPWRSSSRLAAIGRAVGTGARLAGHWWKWLKWPAGVGILAWLYFRNKDSLAQVARSPKDWGDLFLGLALVFGSTLLTFARWFLLVRAQEFPFQFRDALRYGFVGLVTNYVGPGSVGGDLFKAVLLARDQTSRRTAAVATVLLDRILGLLALFIVGVIATLLPHAFPDSPEVQANTLVLWVGTLSGLAGVAFLLIPATTRWRWVERLPALPLVGHVLGELIHGVRLYQSKPAVVLAALALSLAGHAGLIAGFYCCALAMQQPWIPDLTGHFYFMPNAELFGVVSMIPGGVGALEAAVEQAYYWLSPEDIPAAQSKAAGIAAALAFRVVQLAVAAVGGVYYVASRREISQAMEEASHLQDA